MIIVTRSVLVGIDQSCSIPVFKFLLYKVNIYRKAHFYLFEDSVKIVLRGKGRV